MLIPLFCFSQTTDLAEKMDEIANQIDASLHAIILGTKPYDECMKEVQEHPKELFLKIAREEIIQNRENSLVGTSDLSFEKRKIIFGSSNTVIGGELLSMQATTFNEYSDQAFSHYLGLIRNDNMNGVEALEVASVQMQQKMLAKHGEQSEKLINTYLDKISGIDTKDPINRISHLQKAKNALKQKEGAKAIEFAEVAFSEGEGGAREYLITLYEKALKKYENDGNKAKAKAAKTRLKVLRK